MTVSFLGLILEKEYGKDIWDYFTTSTKNVKKSYTYLKRRKMVVTKKEAENIPEWNLGVNDDPDDGFYEGITKVVVGKIDMRHNSRGRQLDDESVASTRIVQEYKSVAEDEKEEEDVNYDRNGALTLTSVATRDKKGTRNKVIIPKGTIIDVSKRQEPEVGQAGYKTTGLDGEEDKQEEEETKGQEDVIDLTEVE